MSLLTFFLVFYGNNCYARYYELHGHCIGLGRSMGLWAQLVRQHFSHLSAAARWNMVRPMLGAHHVHYRPRVLARDARVTTHRVLAHGHDHGLSHRNGHGHP